MKRVMFGLTMLVVMISLPLGALFVNEAMAESPETQIVFTTIDGDYIVDLEAPGDLEEFGDPDDAITGNRGTGTLSAILELFPGLVDEDGNVDMVAFQMILDLLTL